LKWDTPLIEATLLKRYKRFLADINLNEQLLTVHVPNTGSMQSCWGPQWPCAISTSENPSRKMPHTLELIWNGVSWIGVNTSNANKLAKLWLEHGELPELKGYSHIRSEVKFGESRIDFYLDGHPTEASCYVEVKNVTLKMDDKAQFPDSVSIRGQKHLRELIEIKRQGMRAAMLYIVQREDVDIFCPADSIDPVYGKLLREAAALGVEILVYQCKMDLKELSLGRALPLQLG
jgi:sugar fermentation stimulation protein A